MGGVPEHRQTLDAASLRAAKRSGDDGRGAAHQPNTGAVVPWKPAAPCPVCRRLGCTAHPQQRKPWQGSTPTKQRRPEYHDPAQRKRRADAVAAFLSEHGFVAGDGTMIAHCPDCRQVRARFVADHVTPLALGGREDGPLRIHCVACSRKQGSQVGGKLSHHRGPSH